MLTKLSILWKFCQKKEKLKLKCCRRTTVNHGHLFTWMQARIYKQVKFDTEAFLELLLAILPYYYVYFLNLVVCDTFL